LLKSLAQSLSKFILLLGGYGPNLVPINLPYLDLYLKVDLDRPPLRANCAAWTRVFHSFLSYPQKHHVALPFLQEYRIQRHMNISVPSHLPHLPSSTNPLMNLAKNHMALHPLEENHVALHPLEENRVALHPLQENRAAPQAKNRVVPRVKNRVVLQVKNRVPQAKNRVAPQARKCRALLQQGVSPNQKLTVISLSADH
jgi:hypothetical protein